MLHPEYRKVVLESGATLVFEKHEHVRSVSLGVWVKIGSSFESPSQNGICHFIEHMAFKGTETRTPLQIATVLESLGGELNAFTDKEVTCYHATVLNEHVDIALDVLSDLVLRATFPKAELERERKVLLQELSMIEDSPEDWIHDLLFQSVWPDEPLGRPIIGNRHTIQTLSRASLLSFFKGHYRPENLLISVAGNLDFEPLRERCEHYFRFAPASVNKTKSRRPSRYRAKKRQLVANTEQLHLLLGFEGVSAKDSSRFDALLMSLILGGGMSSRLFQEVREKAGLAYSIECDFIPFSEAGLFTIYAAMHGRSLSRCLRILGRELEKLKAEPVADTDLDLVKGQLKGAILLCSDQMETRQEALARNEIIYGRYVNVDEVLQEIEGVSSERIQEMARRVLVPEKETILTLSRAKQKQNKLTVFS